VDEVSGELIVVRGLGSFLVWRIVVIWSSFWRIVVLIGPLVVLEFCYLEW